MRLAARILKILLLLFFTVSIILFTASLVLQDKVADIVLKSLNKNLSTKLDIGSFRLSFLRKFPNASLELKDVVVHSSPGFQASAFKGINTDTLLSARFVSAEFKLTDIYKGIYNIERIAVRAGKLNIYSDTAGFVNYNISLKNHASSTDNITINLERINLTDISTYYNDLSIKLIMNGVIKTGRFKSRIDGDIIDLTAVADLRIDRFQLYGTVITRSVVAGLDLAMESTKKGYLFKRGKLTIEDWVFGLSGSVSAEDFLDLKVTGKNIDLSRIGNYFPEKYAKMAAGYDPSGLMQVTSSFKGVLSHASNPHIEIKALFENGRIKYRNSNLAINNVSFEGFFTNGAKNLLETSTIKISNVKAKLGSGEFRGSLVISQLKNPSAEILLNGKVFPGELKEFFDLSTFSTASGSIDVDLKLITSLKFTEKLTLAQIIDLKPEANLSFNSVNLGLKNDSLLFSEITGVVNIGRSVQATDLRFDYKGEKIKLDGEFSNLPEWIDGRPVQLIATADISFNKLVPEHYLSSTYTSDKSGEKRTAFKMPDNLILDINFRIDSLDYKTFSSTKIEGSLTYKPDLLTFKSLNMNALSGTIAGSGFIFQNGNKSVITKGNFDVNSIDINKTFITFHNFGQEFLKSENIRGSLSGTLSLLLPLDSMLKPQIKSLTAEGKYLLTNGSLVNFEPVKELATFVELSELEKISFQQLENDFFIRNNFLFIPQMDVKSSVADLSVNGKHSFDNEYEYHVKILLSEILSKKRKKNKSNVTEFGVVEDDGLGRTSLLLKVNGKGESIKVGYDIKAAGNEVKNNIKSERQTLKTILNQEYGWFKKDSIPIQKPVEKKSRFNINWDEEDSVKTPATPASVKKKID
jgi:hypothetical protein